MNANAINGLAIIQIVIGIQTVCFGIISTTAFDNRYWVNASGSGIWLGVWILVTGITGFYSSKNPSSNGLNVANMGFNIVCCVVSIIVGKFFSIAVIYYGNCVRYARHPVYHHYVRNPPCWNKSRESGIAVYAILTVGMAIEFVVSMLAAIYCCLGGCCGATKTIRGDIIQQQKQQTEIVTIYTTDGAVTNTNQKRVGGVYQPLSRQTQRPYHPTMKPIQIHNLWDRYTRIFYT